MSDISGKETHEEDYCLLHTNHDGSLGDAIVRKVRKGTDETLGNSLLCRMVTGLGKQWLFTDFES